MSSLQTECDYEYGTDLHKIYSIICLGLLDYVKVITLSEYVLGFQNGFLLSSL